MSEEELICAVVCCLLFAAMVFAIGMMLDAKLDEILQELRKEDR